MTDFAVDHVLPDYIGKCGGHVAIGQVVVASNRNSWEAICPGCQRLVRKVITRDVAMLLLRNGAADAWLIACAVEHAPPIDLTINRAALIEALDQWVLGDQWVLEVTEDADAFPTLLADALGQQLMQLTDDYLDRGYLVAWLRGDGFWEVVWMLYPPEADAVGWAELYWVACGLQTLRRAAER